MTCLGSEQCSLSLRDAFGASTPLLRSRGCHLGRVGTQAHRILNTKNPRHFRVGGLLYLGA